MQDSAKLLGFSASRTLNFNSSRALSIPIGRQLQFDSDRDLSFDFSRELPYGKRGVLFRGYACPVCGGQVYAEAKQCDECGVAFAAPEEAGVPAKPTQSKSQDFREQKNMASRLPTNQPIKKAQPLAAPPVRKPTTFQCPVCNTQVQNGSSSCPKCTVQFVFQAPPPPPEDALVLCPICDLKVSSKTDYCTRCGEPLSPGAIARHKRELKVTRVVAEEPGLKKMGEPQNRQETHNTITWDEYVKKNKGG
jgi:hypothetical protein